MLVVSGAFSGMQGKMMNSVCLQDYL